MSGPAKIYLEKSCGKRHAWCAECRPDLQKKSIATLALARDAYEPPSLRERFEANVVRGNGCYGWLGYKDTTGYGRIFDNGRERPAHQIAYELYIGPIPDGMHVLHHCDNRSCTRADHLFLGTQEDNMRDAAEKGRMRNGRRERTHCPQEHPYDEANTYVTKDGHRVCRTCNREQALRHYYQKRNESAVEAL